MARIYIARTTGIGSFERHVVLKMILPERASDKHSVDMFLDEARLAAALNHQNVAQVFEVGQEAGVHYLAMEYVHGQDLRAVLSKAGHAGTRIPIELSLAIVAGAASGLHHAHDRKSPDGVPLGIVHRDVSPSNIMIGYDGAVKLLDFGIAKATLRSQETQSGIIKGKFAYMSPEQCRGREVDRRSDVFSLGIILYEITTQHRCFRADSDFDTMHRIVTGDVVRPSRLVASYPAELEKIVMSALAVDPVRRFASASAMLEELEAFAAHARLAPSTNALGRFMRELFGEVPEPWLAEGRAGSAGLSPRENTVSNTMDREARFGRGGGSSTQEPSEQIQIGGGELENLPGDTWPPKNEPSRSGNTWAAKPSSRARGGIPGLTPQSMSSVGPGPGSKQGAAQTLLDLPRGGAEVEDAVDWDAKAYPQAQPTFASQLEVPVERKPSMSGHTASSHPAHSAPAVPPHVAHGGNHGASHGPAHSSGQGGAPLHPPALPHPTAAGSTPPPLSTGQPGQNPTGENPALRDGTNAPMSAGRAAGSSTLRSATPPRRFGMTGPQSSPPPVATPPSGAPRSATSAPLSMPQLAPLSDGHKTSTASAIAALPLGTSSFSSLEGSAEKKLRADSLAADLRPQRRVLIVVMVMILVAAFAALLVIALGGDDVATIGPRDPMPTGAGPEAGGAETGGGSVTTNLETGAGAGTPAIDAGAAPPVNGSDAGAVDAGAAGTSADAGSATGGTAGTGAGSAGTGTPPDDRTVAVTMHLQVTSDPKGADVYLNGKRLGLTPLSVFLPKRTGTATLSVRRQRFIESSAKIDLSSPVVSKSFSLRRQPERPSGGGKDREEGGEGGGKKSCQRPESFNPFDDTPICQ